MGILATVASGIGILKSHGVDGEQIGSLFAGIFIIATAVTSAKKPEEHEQKE